MNVKGVFFDLYGTLYILEDPEKELEEWLDELYIRMKRRGLTYGKEVVLDYIQNHRNNTAVPRPNNGMTIFEKRLDLYFTHFRIKIPRSELENTVESLISIWNKYARLDPMCLRLLRQLKNTSVVTALISNYDHPQAVHKLMRETGMREYFTSVVISGDHGVNKPDPAIFHLALNNTRLKPSEMIFVGDSEEDVVGANNSRLISVLIDREGHGKNYGQQFTISSLQDVSKVIS